MPKKPDSTIRTLLACLMPFVALYLIYGHYQHENFRKRLSAEIHVGRVIEFGSEMGIPLGGCGAATFEIAPSTENANDYASWQKTPYVETGDGLTLVDRWTVGLDCADLNQELAATIRRAFSLPGSHYKKLDKAGIIVIPSAGIVAFIYFD
jgi:hypothetical protein